MKCVVCQQQRPYRYKRWGKCCSYNCKEKLREQQAALNGTVLLAAGTVGAISELRAAADLLSKGYEVFRALSPSCSCDLAILRNSHIIRVEVRTGQLGKNGIVPKGQMNQMHRADILALVLPDKIVYHPPLSEVKVNGTQREMVVDSNRE